MRPLFNLRNALRQLIAHPGRTLLVQNGMAIGVATLVTTLCLVEGSQRHWAGRLPADDATHVRVEHAPNPLLATVRPFDRALLADLREAFGDRIASTRRRPTFWRLIPGDPSDRDLATEIEIWLIERGVPVRAGWHEAGARRAAVVRHIDTIGTFFYMAGFLCLLSGTTCVLAVLWIAADQRTVEFALRRTEGARRSDVVWHLAWESLLVSALGVAVGVPSGIGVGHLLARLIEGAAVAVPAAEIAAGSAALLVAGLVFGILPAWRTARPPPARWLRRD